MKLPPPMPNKKPPIIMVGPGTGVAAFRSFIQCMSLTRPDQKLVLVFGCRHRDKDFYYQEEWKQLPNLTVITAFSRD